MVDTYVTHASDMLRQPRPNKVNQTVGGTDLKPTNCVMTTVGSFFI